MRILATGDLTYFFLGWNLLLAGIPYGLAGFLSARFAGWKNWLLIMAWLLFLPNAPYIITDFLHLKHRPPVPYWFDVLLLFSAAMNGLMLGILSLLKVERFLTGRYGNRMSAFLMFGCVFLSGLGIYSYNFV